MVPSCGNARSGRDEFRGTFELPHRASHGNPEPSRRYTGGRCRDYLGAGHADPTRKCRLDTRDALHDRHRASRTLPHSFNRACAGEEIVHSRWKRRGEVNPLVVGSNPTGPRSSAAAVMRKPTSTACASPSSPRLRPARGTVCPGSGPACAAEPPPRASGCYMKNCSEAILPSLLISYTATSSIFILPWPFIVTSIAKVMAIALPATSGVEAVQPWIFSTIDSH